MVKQAQQNKIMISANFAYVEWKCGNASEVKNEVSRCGCAIC